jgi:voltage-gated potassium channel
MYVESFSSLRAFRLLRIVRVLRLLRLVQALRRLRSSVEFVNRVFTASRLGYTLSIAALLVLAMSAGFWILEHGKNPSLRSYDDALWWAMSTTTTVGYGDIAPQTGAGRLLASCLMLFGIGLVGVVASSLSAAIYHVGQQNQTSPTAAIEALIESVEDLVVRRERGDLTPEDFDRLKKNLVTIARIKTE